VAAGLLEPEFWIPEFEILVIVSDEHEDANAFEGLVVRGDVRHGLDLLKKVSASRFRGLFRTFAGDASKSGGVLHHAGIVATRLAKGEARTHHPSFGWFPPSGFAGRPRLRIDIISRGFAGPKKFA
jgi:hypothetical protein